MRREKNTGNYFDEMDGWEDSSRSRKQPTFQETYKKGPDEAADFYDLFGADSTPRQINSGSDRRSGRSGRSDHSGSGKKLIKTLAAAAVCIFAVAVLWNLLPFGQDRETPGVEETVSLGVPAATQEPVFTVPDITLSAPEPQVQKEYRYFGNMLTAEQKKIYDIIQEGISLRDDVIGPFKTASTDEVQLVVDSIFYDYPEYFWFHGTHNSSYYTYDTHLEYTFCPQYEYSAQECSTYAAFVEAAAQPILNQLAGKSDYEKVKGVYEYLVDHTIYDLDYTGTTIYEMFHEGRGVCEGYARASQYLLTKLGVETLFVTGSGGEYSQPSSSWESHAWNIVKIDGQYYQMDTTWGDPLNDDGTQTKSFSYLNLTDKEMARRHIREEWRPYPPCMDVDYNYYVYEGNYLEIYSQDTIKGWFREAYAKGIPLEFKCANEDVYVQVCDWLIGDEGFVELYRMVIPSNQAFRYSYSTTDELYILNVSGE